MRWGRGGKQLATINAVLRLKISELYKVYIAWLFEIIIELLLCNFPATFIGLGNLSERDGIQDIFEDISTDFWYFYEILFIAIYRIKLLHLP